MNSSSSPISILRLIEGIFFLSGASALIYEVVWLRQMTQVFGNTTHATATGAMVYAPSMRSSPWT